MHRDGKKPSHGIWQWLAKQAMAAPWVGYCDPEPRNTKGSTDIVDLHAGEYEAMPGTTKRYAGPRKVRSVVGVAIHQTACVFGTTKRQRDKWGGEDMARMARLKKQPYHYVITHDGRAVRCNPLDAWTWATGPANRTTAAIAFEGHWPPGGKGPRLSEAHRRAFRSVLLDVAHRVDAAGGSLRWYTPHADWSKSRMADPGPAIWALLGEEGPRARVFRWPAWADARGQAPLVGSLARYL